MSQNNAVFKCPVCESLVEALEMYGPELTCCGRVMELQREQTGGLSREHHAPIVRRCGDEVCVHVGSVPHAMTERHHIQWIEVLSGGACSVSISKPATSRRRPSTWHPIA